MDKHAALTHSTSWHEGEVAIQRRAGVAEQMAPIASYVNIDRLADQHRRFFPQLPFAAAGTVAANGDAWATILCGHPGFLQSPDPGRLRVQAHISPSDPARAGLGHGDAIGLLGIELHTRRRNRLNGAIQRIGSDTDAFDIVVEQSYGNCPQYIHRREYSFARDPAQDAALPAQALATLDAHAIEMIRNASTFFIASYVTLENGRRQVDVSHKGGRPGFVGVDRDNVITIPDYAGNLYFNTLGNIYVNPKCGLVFVDFETGDMLQLTGDATVIMDAPEMDAFQGAEHFIKFIPRGIVFRPGALPLRWTSTPQGISPSVSRTGTWTEAKAQLDALDALKASWRPFKINKIADECALVRSLYLLPDDGAGLLPHQAGQHIAVRVALPNTNEFSVKPYALSSAMQDKVYRLSFKREGAVSQFLSTLKVGDIVEAHAPAGTFTIDAYSPKIAVLIAAGIGIAPILAMLRHIVHEGLRTGRMRPTRLIYAARAKAERAFDQEIESLVKAAHGAVRLTRLLSDMSSAASSDYDIAGRIDLDVLRAYLPVDDHDLQDGHDFYICGPAAFTQDLYELLRKVGVADSSIHSELSATGAAGNETGLEV
ncbi:MAG TPA: pyridoxamine 5'-phosphate oxidase family protein [Herbaspirillum sp.]|jgi:hypothetical protein